MHLCPGLGGGEEETGREKETSEGRWEAQREGGGGEERGDREGGGVRAPLTCLRVHTSISDSPGVPGVTGRGDPTVLPSPDHLTMDNYCETHHSSPDAAEPAEGSHDVEHVALRSLAVVVALCGLVGNGIVIRFVCLSHKKTSFLIYSLNLAIVDFMNLGFQILFSVRQILKPFLHRCFGLHALFTVLRWFFYLTGLGIMTAISFQRCLSALFPIWYRCHCPKHLSAVVSALLWSLTFLLNMLRGYACGQLFTREEKFCDEFKTATAVSVFLQFSILGISSLLLLQRVQASSQKHQPRKFHLVLLLSFLGFLLGLPLSIIRFCTTEKIHVFNDICVLLSCINSTANPAIYVFTGSLQKERSTETLQVVLQRALGEETEDAEDQKVTPTGKTESVGL